MTVKAIDVFALKKMIDEKQQFQLIDCREPVEYEFCNIGGELIPMGDVMDNVDKIRKDIPVIVQCRSGARSAQIIEALQQHYGFNNLYNLEGGILAWSDKIDSTIPKY